MSKGLTSWLIKDHNEVVYDGNETVIAHHFILDTAIDGDGNTIANKIAGGSLGDEIDVDLALELEKEAALRNFSRRN